MALKQIEIISLVSILLFNNSISTNDFDKWCYNRSKAEIGEKNNEVKTPWLVYLKVTDHSEKSISACGASIIAENWIVTAAHCICNHFDCGNKSRHEIRQIRVPEENLKMKMGMMDRNLAFLFPDYTSKRVFVHPLYDTSLKTSPNDIALIQTEQNIPFEKGKISPICMASKLPNHPLNNLKVTGWGATSDPKCLTKVGSPSLLQECQVIFAFLNIFDLNLLCAFFWTVSIYVQESNFS